jgi:hypothetical protein
MRKIVRFSAVTALFQSIPKTVVAANLCDLAYNVGERKPGDHVPFTAESPQTVAQNSAGLYAADTSANLIAVLRHGFNDEGKVDEADYTEALEAIATKSLDEHERFIAKNEANLAWRSGQPFRDIVKEPLIRITRSVNRQFNELPPNEEDKDLVQVVEGAKILLELAEEENVPQL